MALLVGLYANDEFGKLSAMLHEHVFLLAEALKDGASASLKATKLSNENGVIPLDSVSKEILCALVAKNFFATKSLKVDGKHAENTIVLAQHPLIYRGVIVAIKQAAVELCSLPDINERVIKKSVARVLAEMNLIKVKATKPGVVAVEQPSAPAGLMLNILDGDPIPDDCETPPIICLEESSDSKDEASPMAKRAKHEDKASTSD